MFRTAGKPRVAQPPQRDNVVADPISLTSPCGCTCPREKRRRRGAQCAPGGRRDIRLLTSVWRRRLGNVFSCVPGSRRAFLRRCTCGRRSALIDGGRTLCAPTEGRMRGEEACARRAADSRPYEGQRRLCRPPFTGSAARGCDFAAASRCGKREDRRTEKTSWARPGRPPQKIHNNTVEKNGPIW